MQPEIHENDREPNSREVSSPLTLFTADSWARTTFEMPIRKLTAAEKALVADIQVVGRKEHCKGDDLRRWERDQKNRGDVSRVSV